MSARASQKNRVSDVGEFGLIDLIKKQTAANGRVIKGIGDDTAVIPLSARKYMLFTTDMLLEGVHFTRKMTAAAVGRKALACSISDMAAMGGQPAYAVVSLGVPSSCPRKFVTDLYRGMQTVAKPFGVAVVGGDTVKSKSVIINVALTGDVAPQDIVYRKGAHIGDKIFVTGRLGGSLKSGRHLRFVPRVREAQLLVKKYKPTAMIDISDGLAADLGHILSESRVGAVIEEKCIPLGPKASVKQGLFDGEDFELLFTLPPAKAKRLLKQKEYRFSCIGEIVSRKHGLQLKNASGTLRKIDPAGYTHF